MNSKDRNYKAVEIREQGRLAALAGRDLDDNPYRRAWGTKGSDVFKASWWDAGYLTEITEKTNAT